MFSGALLSFFLWGSYGLHQVSLMAQLVKESACNAGDLGSIPGLGRSPEEGLTTHSSILAWKIPTGRGAWRATVPGLTKSDTTERLSTVQGLHHNLLPSETYHSRG